MEIVVLIFALFLFFRLGRCEVCDSQDAKYSCPACEVKTCCLACVNIHKKELNCDGVRNRVGYKPLSKFNNMDLQSDYMLLEEMTRSVETFSRDKTKRFTRMTTELPPHLFKLRAAATRRGTHLCFLPQCFTRHKENTTFFNWKTQLIKWRIDWIFPECDNLKISSDQCLETELLSHFTRSFLECDSNTLSHNQKLQPYCAIGLPGLLLLLKAELRRTKEAQFFELDPHESLRENLKRKTIIEYPTIYVVKKHNKHMFNIVDVEEESEIEVEDDPYDTSGKKAFLTIRKRHAELQNKNKSLLFSYSDQSSSENESEEPRKKISYDRPVNQHYTAKC